MSRPDSGTPSPPGAAKVLAYMAHLSSDLAREASAGIAGFDVLEFLQRHAGMLARGEYAIPGEP